MKYVGSMWEVFVEYMWRFAEYLWSICGLFVEYLQLVLKVFVYCKDYLCSRAVFGEYVGNICRVLGQYLESMWAVFGSVLIYIDVKHRSGPHVDSDSD